MTATRDSWQRIPLGRAVHLPYSATFTADEADLLRRGLIPGEMEDKWFIFWESDSLFFHRSWTGQAVYQVDFRQAGNQLEVTRALVTAGTFHYRRGKDPDEVALLDFLIRGLLLHQPVAFPVPADTPIEASPGVFQAHVTGTGFPERQLPAVNETWTAWLKRLLRLPAGGHHGC